MIITCEHCQERHLLEPKNSLPFLCRCGRQISAKLAKPFFPALVRCSNCGGSASADLKACAYCNAVFRPFSTSHYCAECHAFLMSGAKFCSWCGSSALNPIELLKDNTVLKCPRDGTVLERIDLVDRPAHKCPQCEGIWLATSAFEELKADAHEALEYMEELESASGVEAVVRYARCPVCKQQMHRANFARRSGVILDSCRPDGTWFDRDELRRVLGFIRAGGVHETKVRELEERVRQAKNISTSVQEEELRLRYAIELLRKPSRS